MIFPHLFAPFLHPSCSFTLSSLILFLKDILDLWVQKSKFIPGIFQVIVSNSKEIILLSFERLKKRKMMMSRWRRLTPMNGRIMRRSLSLSPTVSSVPSSPTAWTIMLGELALKSEEVDSDAWEGEVSSSLRLPFLSQTIQ